ncbi:tetratricopeptide repeat protein [Planctomycetota bacterium]
MKEKQEVSADNGFKRVDFIHGIPPWLFWILASLLLVVVARFAFGTMFDNRLTNWDDDAAIELNKDIRDFSPAGIKKLFTRPVFNAYLPLYMLSYAANLKMAGGIDGLEDNLRIFLETNFLLHVLCALLLGAILQHTFHNRLFSCATALIFVCLPVNTEAVVWLSARKETLSLFFFLLSLYFFIRFLEIENYRGRGLAYVVALLAALAAMLSKGNTIILPLILVLYHLCFRTQGGDSLMGHIRKIMVKAHYHMAFMLMMIIMTFVHLAVAKNQGAISNIAADSHILERLTTSAGIFLEYIYSFFIPSGLSPDYPVVLGQGIMPMQVAGIIILAMLPFVLYFSFNWNRMLFFVICWFLITLAPYSNLLPTSIMKADRYLYIASIAYCMLFGYMVTLIWYASREKKYTKPIAAVILLCTVAFNTAATRQYADTWQDSRQLWSRVLKLFPANIKARFNLAKHYSAGQRWLMARNELEIALRFGKQDFLTPSVANELAFLYIKDGAFKQAIDLLDSVLPEDIEIPADDNYRAAYARLLNSRGQAFEGLWILEKAFADYQQALHLSRQITRFPPRTELEKVYAFNLGQLSGRMHRFNVAEESLRNCLQIDDADRCPPPQPHGGRNVGRILY